MNWLLKAAIQKGLSFVPYSHKLNFYLQRYITVGKYLSEDFVTDRLFHLRRHINYASQYCDKPLGELRTVEIGTGWYPIIPVGLYLAGFNHIITCDVKPLFNNTSFNQTLIALNELFKKGKLSEYIPFLDEQRVNNLHEALEEEKLEEKFKKFNILPLTGDTRNLDLEEKSQDYIVSNNTLQVIPLSVVEGVYREMARITRSKGVMSHSIDLSDQYSIYDESLNSYNYLKYSEGTWNLFFNNKHQHQNRMRLPYYKELLEKYGFNLVLQEHDDEGSLKELNEIQIDKQFQKYNKEEVAIRQTHLVAIKQ